MENIFKYLTHGDNESYNTSKDVVTKPLFFKNPVMASDGYMYEAGELHKWISANGYISPNTGQPIDRDIRTLDMLENFISDLLITNKNLLRYNCEEDIPFLIKPIDGNTLFRLMSSDSQIDLKKYYICLENIDRDTIYKYIRELPLDKLIYIFCNAVDFDTWDEKNNIMHMSIIGKNSKFMEYIIKEKNLNINRIDANNGTTPIIKSLCDYQVDCSIVLIDMGADIFCDLKQMSKRESFYYVCKYSNFVSMQYIFKHRKTQILQKYDKYYITNNFVKSMDNLSPSEIAQCMSLLD